MNIFLYLIISQFNITAGFIQYYTVEFIKLHLIIIIMLWKQSSLLTFPVFKNDLIKYDLLGALCVWVGLKVKVQRIWDVAFMGADSRTMSRGSSGFCGNRKTCWVITVWGIQRLLTEWATFLWCDPIWLCGVYLNRNSESFWNSSCGEPENRLACFIEHYWVFWFSFKDVILESTNKVRKT